MEKEEKIIQEVLKKHNVRLGYEMAFPRYKILPDEVQLALKILQKHDMKILLVLKPRTP